LGLIVPVVKSADEKNILGIQRTMNDLAERARSKKLRPKSPGRNFLHHQSRCFGGLFVCRSSVSPTSAFSAGRH